MKWVAIAFVFFVCVALENKMGKQQEEMRRVAQEEACRVLVEAGLVSSCGPR